jgi:hypothetical protein
MGNSAAALPAARCNRSCPLCCTENLEELRARADASLRAKALLLSAICVIMLLAGHIVYVFQSRGQSLPIPEIVWVVCLAPWCGEGIGKIVGIIKK